MVGQADAAPWRLAVYLVQLRVRGGVARSYPPPDAFVFVVCRLPLCAREC